jgi:hypothetical protein
MRIRENLNLDLLASVLRLPSASRRPQGLTRRERGVGGLAQREAGSDPAKGKGSTETDPNHTGERDKNHMRKFLTTLTIFFLFVAPVVAEAAASCPAEVQSAKDMLKKQTAKADESQAPRSLAGARSESNAPRSREANAPRVGGESAAPRSGGESAAPRSREANAPRVGGESAAPRSGGESAAPRSREANAPRVGGESAAPRSGGESAAPRSREANAPRVGGESAAPRVQQDAPQAPRTLAGARTQESNAPRGQEANAPRTREANAPRVGGESAAPRGQDSAAPRTTASAPQISKARTLVKEAEAACKAGDMTKATQKAKAAMELMK